MIEAIPNGGLLFLLDGEDGDGRPINFQYGGPTDGSGQFLPGDSGLVLVLKRDAERTIESLLNRGEMVLDRWTRELLPDGETMKITQYVPNTNGREFQNTGLYRRLCIDLAAENAKPRTMFTPWLRLRHQAEITSQRTGLLGTLPN